MRRRRPPLEVTVEPAVEQLPLEAQLRQKEALAIAAIAHIKELETKHKVQLTMLIHHIFVQGVYEWAKCFAAMLDFQGRFEDIEGPFGNTLGSLSGDTNYWPEGGTDFQSFSRLLGVNPWQDAATEFIRPPIELAVDDLDTDATVRPWSPP